MKPTYQNKPEFEITVNDIVNYRNWGDSIVITVREAGTANHEPQLLLADKDWHTKDEAAATKHACWLPVSLIKFKSREVAKK